MADYYVNSRHVFCAMKRRTILTALSGITLGATGLAFTTRESEAMQVDINGLNVGDTDRDVANPVAAVQLSVDGSYQYETSVTPTRLVLRLEVKPPSGGWSQIDAFAIRNNLPESKTDNYTLEGNILKHPAFDASAFTPANRGESKQVDITARVRMSVSNEGKNLGEKRATDSASIVVTKTAASVEMSLGGDGSVGITTTS